MTDREKYYDALMVRGYYMPERSLLEATTAGARADSETHGQAALAQAMSVDRDIARHLSWYAVDDMLA